MSSSIVAIVGYSYREKCVHTAVARLRHGHPLFRARTVVAQLVPIDPSPLSSEVVSQETPRYQSGKLGDQSFL